MTRTRGGVLAQALRQGDEPDVLTPGQSLEDLQAGRALVAVDENARAQLDAPMVKSEGCRLSKDW